MTGGIVEAEGFEGPGMDGVRGISGKGGGWGDARREGWGQWGRDRGRSCSEVLGRDAIRRRRGRRMGKMKRTERTERTERTVGRGKEREGGC